MNTSSCIFYNKSFMDDMYPYTISYSDNKYLISYNIEGGELSKRDLNFTLPDIISNPVGLSSNKWSPVFIDLAESDSRIQNDYLASGFTMNSPNLGIESVIKFDPQLRNWNFLSNSKDAYWMNVDWILTSPLYPYLPSYGILCWAKTKELNIPTNYFTIDKIPYNTVVYPLKSWAYYFIDKPDEPRVFINPQNKLIKKTDDILLILDNEQVINDSEGNVKPGLLPKYVSLNSIVNYENRFITDPEKRLKKENILFTTNQQSNDNIIYHISDGEAYTYYKSQETEREERIQGLSAQSYISPVLHDIYREIYHHLTIRFKRPLFIGKVPKPIFTRKQDRRLKQICYFLCTHPQIDRTTVSILQYKEISDFIDNFINRSYPTSKLELRDALIFISNFFKDINIDEAKYHDKAYLPRKLLEKYGATLRCDEQCSLFYKDKLPDGPHLKVTSDIRSLSKKLSPNKILTDNIEITVGPFNIKTILDNSQSSIELSSPKLSSKKNIVPLWDIKKTTFTKDEQILFSAGPDIEINFDNILLNNDDGFFTVTKSKEDELKIDLLQAGLGFFQDESILAGVDIEFNWSRIFGPDCLRFSNNTISQIRNNGVLVGSAANQRFDSSQDEYPTIYIKKPGKYVVRFSVRTPFGTKSQNLTIYIVDKKTYKRPVSEIPRPKRLTDLLPDDRKSIMVHGLKEFVVGKQGIFWPVYSDLSVYEPRYIEVPSVVAGLTSRRRVGNVVRPLGSVLNKFLIPFEQEKLKDYLKNDFVESESASRLFFKFKPSPGVTTEIGSIVLSHINSSSNPHCEPIYREVFDNFLVDLEMNTEKVLSDPISNQDFDIPRPADVGTNKLITNTASLSGNRTISNAMFNTTNINFIFDEYNYEGNIYSRNAFGFSTNDAPVACYEVMSKNEDLQKLTTIKMKKGYFHPNSGWLVQERIQNDKEFNNRTSIMIGDGSKRYCKTFRGLGFSTLNNDFIDDKIKIYTSTINLSMDPAAHDPAGDMTPEQMIEFEKQELDDHNINHGYRSINNTIRSVYKHSDDFFSNVSVSPEQSTNSDAYCGQGGIDGFVDPLYTIGEINAFIGYSYPKPGPILAPKSLPRKFRFERGVGRSIGDLEIKLNYLNYINPKELVIWLEVDPPSEVTVALNPRGENQQPKDPLYFGPKTRQSYLSSISGIINKDIMTYASGLFQINDNRSLGINDKKQEAFDSTYFLYLLNQDHIGVSFYNNIVKFTDIALYNKNNNINVKNFITLDNSQNRLKNGIIELAPTLSAPGYSDEEINLYKSIIYSNRLQQDIPSTFSKFNNLPMFARDTGGAKNPPPPNSDSISFSLRIAVMSESDDGNVYDRLVYTDNILNINNVRTKNISSILTNSLCSWEIVVNNSKNLLNFEDKDALGHIDYAPKPKYEGYNFIGKISSNIIPPANKDAPNRSIYDIGKCLYTKESLTAPRLIPVPQLNISPISYIPSFTIVGELANMGTLVQNINNQSRAIFDFFNDIRRTRLAEIFNREIYIPNFKDFPTGRSEKSLVSISKDGKLWFKLEAGILKYNNCPVLKKKKFTFKHIHYTNQFKNLCKFTINAIKDPSELIKYKIKSIKRIKANIYTEFILDLQTIINKIEQGGDVFLKYVENKIYDADRRLKLLLEGGASGDGPEELQRIKSDYKNLYETIGPDGVEEDDIIAYTIDDINYIDYYTIVKINNNYKAVRFNHLHELLKINKSLFINNNFHNNYEVLKNAIFKNQKISTEQNQNNYSNIVSIPGTRAYSIYKNEQIIKIFTPKDPLSTFDTAGIESLNKRISDIQTIISDELKKFTPNEDYIEALKNSILQLENDIFLRQHDSMDNTILSKTITQINNEYHTVFVLKNVVKNNSILVIEPKDNRIIALDYKYVSKEDGGLKLNPWTFINQTQLDYNITHISSDNIFNNGMYGAGTVGNKPIYLHTPELVNYVKDFLEYIEYNRNSTDSFSEACEIFLDTEKLLDTKMNNIYTFNIENSQDLILKYENYIKINPKNYKFKDVLEVLENITNYDKYNAFFKTDKIKFLIEGSLDTDPSQIKTEKKKSQIIEFANGYKTETIYGWDSGSSETIADTRAKSIPSIIESKQAEIKNILSRISNSGPITDGAKKQLQKQIDDIKKQISKLQLEYNKLYSYIDIVNTNKNILPNILLKTEVATDDGSTSIQELPDNDEYYILNIDAEQGCSLDRDKMPKILSSIKYECLRVTSVDYVDPYRFCPGSSSNNLGFKFGDYSVTNISPGTVTYTLEARIVEQLKQKYKHPSLKWDDKPQFNTSQRTFFLNGKDTRGGIVRATYTYIVPNFVPLDAKTPEGSLQNKVKDIFNLDNTNEIHIDFKKINRNLRDTDTLYQKYVPTIDGLLVKSITPPPGGPIDNTLKVWECYNFNNGTPVPLPKNFKWMNLVKYMSFYNKFLFLDPDKLFNINGGLDIIKVRDEMGLIPYDYK